MARNCGSTRATSPVAADGATRLAAGLGAEAERACWRLPRNFRGEQAFQLRGSLPPVAGDRRRLCGRGSRDLVGARPQSGITMLEAHCAFELKTQPVRQGARDRSVSRDARLSRAARRSSSATTTRTRPGSPSVAARGGRAYSVGRARPGVVGDVRESRPRCADGSPPSPAAPRPHERSERARRQPLDLALIGNSCVAALVDQQARIVWWCFPLFRRRSGVLAPARRRRREGLLRRRPARTEVDRIALRAQHRDRRDDPHRRGRRGRCASPISRRASTASSAPFRPPQIIRRIEPLAGLPRIAIRVRPDPQLRPPDRRTSSSARTTSAMSAGRM